MSEQRLVIFDLDGTLIDTVSLFVGTTSSVFETMGLAVPDEKIIRSVSGLGAQVGVRRIAPDLDDVQIDKFIGLYREEFLARATQSKQEELFCGALEVLNRLHGRDDIVMAVATGKSGSGTDRVLKSHDILQLFTSVHTPDSNRAKPDPDMVHSAMRIVDCLKQNTIMIGDTTHDMEMAVNAGTHALGVSWGYHEPEELKAAGANLIIDEMDQLIPAIDSLLGEK
ncbi:Similar to phosphoglycolate phosphatase, clustered with ribosomal large subunit pseudouridine synthase C [hydrothermal vent metagenome]|uniref:Similar to phosphoglycolate phosphatase, clustered with ribosomal large subunit pseudouridine synthase C n=2 Tax=hydrothermal vent metagenome TaxID=652676 RepID=A0A3B0USK5_9ZZZZ